MKKIVSIFCGCILLATSCSQPNIEESISSNQNSNEYKFYASFSEDDTRTLLNESMKNTWCSDDRISIFMGNNYNHHYKFDGKTGDTKGTFSKVEDPFITGELLPANYAIYPYSEESGIDDNGVISAILPAIQVYGEDSFGPNANTMVAVTESLDNRFLGFQNVCGYVRVKLYGENVTLKNVALVGNNKEVLAGAAQITVKYGQEPSMTMEDATEKMLTIDCGEGVKIGTTEYDATSFVFVVPPKEMDKGFTIVATDVEGRTYTKESTKAQEIKRNTILSMPELKWVDDNAPKLEIPDGVLTIHNEEKGMLLVALMDYAYDEIVSMKVTGTMNDEDFLWVYYEMPALRYLDISDVNITTLPNRSFYESSNVETIIMPKTLQTIPDEVFYRSVVKEVYLNEGLQTIGVSAFSACNNLTAIHIPQSVASIGKTAFSGCSALATVTFEDGCKLSALDTQVFHGAPIESVRIPANVETIATENLSPFSYCKQLKTVTFEDNSKLKVLGKSFGYSASNNALESIEIPNSVETIESKALAYTSSLQNVFFEPNSSLKTIDTYTFYDCTNIKSIQIPASVQQIHRGAFYCCYKLESVMFENNSSLIDLGIGIDYEAKNGGVFESCSSLTNITIPASVNKIYPRAFFGCSKLSRVEFEDGSTLQVIGGGVYNSGDNRNYCSSGAFCECTSLANITIPQSVKIIEGGAFHQSGLESVLFESGSNIETIEAGTNNIGAFSKTKISSISLPASLITLGACAFRDCTSLKTLKFEDGCQVSGIGYDAFYDCNITTLRIPASITTIQSSAFQSNDNLKIINFDAGSQLSTIGYKAFAECGAINYFYAQNVTQLKTLGDRAFEDCDEMRLFKLGTIECPEASYDSFGDVGTYSVLKVPTESVAAYKNATGWRQFASISGLDE